MLDVIMKTVLVFLILITSISIVSEYICLKTIRIQEQFLTKEQKIDLFLADLKNTLMKKENFESYAAPQEVICPLPKTVQEETAVEEEAVFLNENFSVLAPEQPEIPVIKAASSRPLPALLPGFEPSGFSFAEVKF